MMDLLHVVVVGAEGAVLILNLHGDDGTAVAALQRCQFLTKTMEPARGCGDEGWVGCTDFHSCFAQEPCGVAAELPLGADVRARAQDDEEAFLLGFANEPGDVVLAG